MSYQNISHQLTQDQMNEIMTAITTLNQRLSFAMAVGYGNGEGRNGFWLLAVGP